MSTYFDTHVHFGSDDGSDGIDALVGRALAAGVESLVAVGGNAEMNELALEAAGRFPANVTAAIGFDRAQAAELQDASGGIAAAVVDLAGQIEAARGGPARIVAVGEMGLDFHYSADTAAAQQELFDAELALARRLGLPAIVHSREADEATLEAIRRQVRAGGADAPPVRGVLHCFTGNEPFARELLELGFYISFSGIVTFRNADPLRSVAGIVPDERLLIETDTPYLAPVPHRGRRNEPALVGCVAEMLANVRGQSVETVAELTANNARRLFG